MSPHAARLPFRDAGDAFGRARALDRQRRRPSRDTGGASPYEQEDTGLGQLPRAQAEHVCAGPDPANDLLNQLLDPKQPKPKPGSGASSNLPERPSAGELRATIGEHSAKLRECRSRDPLERASKT